MVTLKRDISYNRACMILYAYGYTVTETKTVTNEWTVFYNNGVPIARYNEPSGRLQVREIPQNMRYYINKYVINRG